MSADGQVRLARQGAAAYVTLDRPTARNAMTWAMYERLGEICDELAADKDLRCVVFQGNEEAFVAGSDIAQFADFAGGEDGIAYEAKMDAYFARMLAIPCPTIASIGGWAVGGGLNIAACCDIRIASETARFGVPIARTLGNCLSMQTYNRLVQGFGDSRTRRMLLLAEFLDAGEALQAGFLSRVVPPDALEETTRELLKRVLSLAPLTLKVTKAALGRIGAAELDPADDLVSTCYGSADFKRGVQSFTQKTKPEWQGK